MHKDAHRGKVSGHGVGVGRQGHGFTVGVGWGESQAFEAADERDQGLHRAQGLWGWGTRTREGFAVSPLEDEVEPLGDEADPEHRDAHPARGVVGHGEVEQKEALGVAQKGDPEPHVLQPGQLVLQRLGHRDAGAQRGLHGDHGAGPARV